VTWLAPMELEGLTETLKEIEADISVKLRKVADFVGIRTIELLRSYINETRPPVRPGEPARKARYGHWADNSGNLARAYDYNVEQTPNSITIVFSNSMDYAAALDVKEGFFVLRGVADRGGPVEQMLRRAVQELAPDWTLSYE